MLSLTALLLIVCIIAISAFAHGIVGFGFPLFSTPLIVLFIDIKLAIIITIVPNLLVNSICMFRDGVISDEVKKHWSMALYVLIGTLFGSHALLYLNDNILKILLVVMILAYLLQERFKHIPVFKTISAYPLVGPAIGLLAGFVSGSVNVASIPLVIYFLSLDIAPKMMIQLINLCFATSKGAQFITLGYSGVLSTLPLWTYILLGTVSVIGVFLGFAFSNRFVISSYRSVMNTILTVIAIILILQIMKYEIYA